ncbi:MAG: hypothetical protein LQ350_005154 [Teloschistes chrysophthalmus]|nr:MAG: hypothetical protein LQ350_005154 [Niorma chrysophthalma]
MPTKIREKDKDREREKERIRDRDPDAIRPKDKSRHRSSRSVRKSSYSKDPERSPTRPERSATVTTPPSTRKPSLPQPDLERRSSSNPATPQGSKTSLPYPTFSKAHSKEAIGSREEIANARLSYYTPDPTDLDRRKEKKVEQDTSINAPAAPPSPPLTTDPVPPATVKRDASPPTAKTTPRKTERKKTDLQKAADELKRKLGRGGSIISEREERVRTPSSRSRRGDREIAQDEDESTLSERRSKPGTPLKSRPKVVTIEDAALTSSLRTSTSPPSSNLKHGDTPTESITDSDATSVAPNQPTTQQPTPHIETVSNLSDETPKTPTLAEPHYIPSRRETPAHDVKIRANLSFRPSAEESPMPPPPPPPPTVPFQMPKVDYLMQNGGLPQAVPKSLLGAGQPPPSTGQPAPALSVQVERFFGPFHGLLDDYTKVMSKSGSLAVATGYRSVARRLLDRLEAVFARNISSETCICTMCQSSPLPVVEDERGLSWGEILEYVCGRQDLPQWPPFVLDSSQMGLGISANMKQTPMQNLDVDVPEEYRDHYVRQSKKTKLAVDRWLETQPNNPTSPPQDIDDETLTFAMLTRLDPEQRPTFSSLIGVGPDRPPSRAGTPFVAPRSELLTQTGLAIQRLYRLSSPPRDPESAIFLLTNPLLHNVLATLAAISDAEWDILISGRFDGFLRSGAEDFPPAVNNANTSTNNNTFSSPSRGPTTTPGIIFPPSRGPTPFTRTQTPATAGAPVAIDEETEIATLAEIEREIYTSMEALEDAFEALHGKAETVRNALRQRGAGLALANQMRRGGGEHLDARLGTPASVWDSETDEEEGDGRSVSELCPDDSASNVSRTRRRRREGARRWERRTPALVEEDEGEVLE